MLVIIDEQQCISLLPDGVIHQRPTLVIKSFNVMWSGNKLSKLPFIVTMFTKVTRMKS